MRLLVYGINYYPEQTGIGKYTAEMCTWLAARGHQVEVITAMPYYPEWKIQQKYKNKWWHTETIAGVKVFRTPLFVPSKVNGLFRILHELTFVFNSSFFWIPCFFKKYDAVIGVCPPLQTGIFPWLYQVFRRKPFIFHVQDLQVDVAVELGMLKNKWLVHFLKRVEKFLMCRASLVSTIGEGMKKRLLQKGVKEENIFLLPNWVDTDFIKPLSKNNSLKKELGFLENDKIILYSGNIGDKQGLEMIINVAEQLKEEASLFFVFCGAGASKNKLEQLSREKKLGNIRFLNVQPYEKLDQLLSMADIHLVLQKKAASDLVFPSKLLSILSAGALSVVTASHGSELYEYVLKNDLGVVIEPENEELLLKALLENIQKDNVMIKENARAFALRELSSGKILARFEKTLMDVCRMLK